MEPENPQTEKRTGDGDKGMEPDITPTAESVESKVTPRQRSSAWDHFKKTEDRDKGMCNHSGAKVKIRSVSGVNTSTMLKHMARCKKLHPELEEEIVAGKRLKQSTLMHQSQKNRNNEAASSYL